MYKKYFLLQQIRPYSQRFSELNLVEKGTENARYIFRAEQEGIAAVKRWPRYCPTDGIAPRKSCHQQHQASLKQLAETYINQTAKVYHRAVPSSPGCLEQPNIKVPNRTAVHIKLSGMLCLKKEKGGTYLKETYIVRNTEATIVDLLKMLAAQVSCWTSGFNSLLVTDLEQACISK